MVSWDRVSRQYFSTVGQPIVRGRDFAESDSSASRPVAIVNESLVRKYFPNEDPIGKHFGMDNSRYADTFEIVGVARDAKYNDPDQPPGPMFFLPLEQRVHYPDVDIQRNEIQTHFVGTIQPAAGPRRYAQSRAAASLSSRRCRSQPYYHYGAEYERAGGLKF